MKPKLSMALALVFLLAVLAGAFWPAGPVDALPSQERECVFYSDASHTEIVGGVFVTCSGVYRWGSVTPHKVCWDYGPC